ncbi:MAG: hypothetical protein CVT89_08720, partial [Candidatus Altiarchaeales archaeon HGW-Altiarchaeales-2]
ISINDTIPGGLNIISWSNTTNASATVNGLCNDTNKNPCQFNILVMQANTYWNITITTKVSSSATEIAGNNATIYWKDNESYNNTTTSNTTSPLGVLKGNVTIRKTRQGGGCVEIGDTITYIINVSNLGNGTAYNVNVKDILPDGTKFDTSSSGYSGNCSNHLSCSESPSESGNISCDVQGGGVPVGQLNAGCWAGA